MEYSEDTVGIQWGYSEESKNSNRVDQSLCLKITEQPILDCDLRAMKRC